MVDAFVINIDSRIDRMNEFNNMIDKLQPVFLKNLTRFSAIVNKDNPRKGCRDSHKEILKIAKERKLDKVLIFEDDAILRKNINERWNIIMDEIPNDWEILVLGCHFGNYLNWHMTNDYWCYISKYFCGTHAIIINSIAYDKIITYIENLRGIHDIDIDVYSRICKKHIYLSVPFISEISGSKSSICDNGSDDNEHLLWCEKAMMIHMDI